MSPDSFVTYLPDRSGRRRRTHHLVACDLLGSHSNVCFALEPKRAVPLFTSYPTKESRPKRFSLGRLQGT